MRPRSSGVPLLAVVLTLGSQAACGKRADPLAPWVKTPQPPSALEVSQVGEEIEVRVMAPRVTIENRPLPVVELTWLQAPPLGVFDRSAVPLLREEVAPGELRTKRFPRPATEVRLSVRAADGKARSTPVAPLVFKPAPVPLAPTGLEVVNTPEGVLLRWINPPGAEPWPSATPSPIPGLPAGLPGASPRPAPGVAPPPPAGTPAPNATPNAAPPLPVPLPTPAPAVEAAAPPVTTASPLPASPPIPGATPPVTGAAVPVPVPTPTPLPPTAIRIFRTDGLPRLAREPLQAATWTDLTLKAGEKPCYALRYASSLVPLVESAPTQPVCAEFKDIIPPVAPGRLLGDLGDGFVELSWLASSSTDVASYRLFRSIEGGARTLVVETPGVTLRVRDTDMTRGPRTYEVVAVDTAGNESPASPLLRIILP